MPQIAPNPLANPLSAKDFTLIIDKSGSMQIRDMPNNQSRWKAAEESVYALAAKTFEFDPDGIDIWLFSGSHTCFRNANPERVLQIFQEYEPCGGTAMAPVLRQALDEYFQKRDRGLSKPNGEMIIVITDGAPDSPDEVTDVLVKAALRLKASDNLSLSFIQIGHDAQATQYLKFLDDDLIRTKGIARDFIKTVKIADMEQQGLRQTLLNVINDSNAPRRTFQ